MGEQQVEYRVQPTACEWFRLVIKQLHQVIQAVTFS